MNQLDETIAGFPCTTWRPDDGEPELLVVLCHGTFETGARLAESVGLLGLSPSRLQCSATFVFPDAPVYGTSTRVWWIPDYSDFIEDNQRGMRSHCPEDLPASRERIIAITEAIMKQTDLPASRVVLGGFSQGAMLATDVALHLNPAPAGLCIWSGCLMHETEWRKRAATQQHFRVFQSHGNDETIVPFADAVALRDLLGGVGFDVEFLAHDYDHTIPRESVDGLVGLLNSIGSSL